VSDVTAPAAGTYGRSVHKVGEPLPQVLVLSDLAAILGVGTTQAWQLEHDGELAKFECLPRVGKRRRYSGKKVQAWVDGEGEAAEPSRYFASARKAAGR
jgi:hypothetical protein